MLALSFVMRADPEWKYVSLRNYIAYLNRSIEKATKWTVFEPNGRRFGKMSAGRSTSFF